MGYGADIIAEAGDRLIADIPKIQEPIKQLLPNLKVAVSDVFSDEFENLSNTLRPGFFTEQSAACLPLIAECVKALGKLPPATPQSASIQRSWFEDMNEKLNKLSRETFPKMEQNVQTFYNPLTEATAKLTAITSILGKLPGILIDFTKMDINLKKVKTGLRR